MIIQCVSAGLGWPLNARTPCAGLPRRLSRGECAGAQDDREPWSLLDQRTTRGIRRARRVNSRCYPQDIRGNKEPNFRMAGDCSIKPSATPIVVRSTISRWHQDTRMVRRLFQPCCGVADLVGQRVRPLCRFNAGSNSRSNACSAAAVVARRSCRPCNACTRNQNTRTECLQKLSILAKESKKLSAAYSTSIIRLELRRRPCALGRRRSCHREQRCPEASHQRKSIERVATKSNTTAKGYRQNLTLRFCRGKT